MLRRPTLAVQLCNDRAAECESLAELAQTISSKHFYLGLATTWRLLAEQRELTDRADNFLDRNKE